MTSSLRVRAVCGLTGILLTLSAFTALRMLFASANGDFVSNQLDQRASLGGVPYLLENKPLIVERSERAILMDPGRAEFYLHQGEFLIRTLLITRPSLRKDEDLSRARSVLKQASRLRPESPYAFAYLAWFELSIAGRADLGSEALVKALQRGPHETSMRMLLIEKGIRQWFRLTAEARDALLIAAQSAAADPASTPRIRRARYAGDVCMFLQLRHGESMGESAWCAS